ncbi:MAG: hypothetical protein M1827_004646 [Pycnora praestabilis]|nr:MAG: hypothetical protein M1827_004646 [Pycnora praestabilis]
MSDEIKPQQHPALHLPSSSSTVEVKIINTTTDIVVPAEAFVQPVIKGHEKLNLPTFAFLVENKKLGRTILFDCGCRKDWWNFAPSVHDLIKKAIPGLNIEKNINEILEEGGVDLKTIESIVWSHWHWDHTGDPSLFPSSAELVVGPGFKEAFMPGYPAKKDSPMLETDFKGRNVREVDFDGHSKIGKFESYDFFGDGSFFLLNVPGHAVGHIGALARTTADTFVFMGGDVCHYGGSFRPTPYVPMPSTLPSNTHLDSRFSHPCPCSLFTPAHPNQEKARTEPFYRVTTMEGSWYIDPPTAQQSIDKLEEFDADQNVFVAVAHDGGLIGVVDWFPHGSLNDWKGKGWKGESLWGFVNELPVDGKPGRSLLAPGLMKDGKVVS